MQNEIELEVFFQNGTESFYINWRFPVIYNTYHHFITMTGIWGKDLPYGLPRHEMFCPSVPMQVVDHPNLYFSGNGKPEELKIFSEKLMAFIENIKTELAIDSL